MELETLFFVAKIVFAVSVLLLFHCYFLFPVTLPFLCEVFRRRTPKAANEKLPRVSILISAYNEEEIIERKIQNLLQLDYPKDLLEILIGDDGSKDRTVEIVSRYEKSGIRLICAERNAGKAAMLNRLHSKATGEIIVLCDANTMFFPNVVRQLVAPFADPKIGCACGHLILTDSSGSLLGKGESSYWDLESEIKKFEGSMDRSIGGNGAIYAIRNSLYAKLPVEKSVMDDFYLAVKVLMKGYYCTFVPSAIGTETTSKASTGEFRRKVRIGRANFNYLPSFLPLLNPFRPLVAYLFFSHKFLRWHSPHLGILCVLSLLVLLFSGEPFFIACFAMVALLLLLGATKIVPQAYYFLSMNFALLKGFFLSFKKEHGGGWAREARGEETTSLPILGILAASLALVLAAPSESVAEIAISAEIGTMNQTDDKDNFNVDFRAHVWYPIDQMVLLGVGSGFESIDGDKFVPITGSLWLRLPFGGVVLPALAGDFGVTATTDHTWLWMWKLGAGADIKNGDRSSILVTAGYQRICDYDGFFYVHAGLMIEF